MSIEDKIKTQVPLAPLTAFKIGGPAKFYVEADNQAELIEAVSWAKNQHQLIYILSGGSNVLISDQGLNGLVIKMSGRDITVAGSDIICGAGASLAQVVKISSGRGLSGLEWAAGIPGTVGGAVCGNAGTKDQAIGQCASQVKIFDTVGQTIAVLSPPDCQFNYRDSIFKHNGQLIILEVRLALAPGDKKRIEEIIRQNISHRLATQPKALSAGCIFKNARMNDINGAGRELISRLSKDELIRNNQIAAGWLIDQAGLKGKTMGGAQISAEHANFIINVNQATAEDVIMLISYVKQQVRDRFGVQLNEEIQYLGF